MELVDYQAGITRLGDLGIGPQSDEPPTDEIRVATYRIPPDSGRKTALARSLVQTFFSGEDVILGITERGVWPSSENERLFLQYRSSFALAQSLDSAPFHYAMAGEEEYVEGLFALSLYFIWGAVLAPRCGGLAVRTSHDEWLQVVSRDNRHFTAVCEMLDVFGLERLADAGC